MVKKSAGFFCALSLSFATVAFAQTDSALTASVKTKLAADDLVKASSVNVTTVDHVVTLAGVVATKAAKDRAIAIARDTSGVTSVVDKLTVHDGRPGRRQDHGREGRWRRGERRRQERRCRRHGRSQERRRRRQEQGQGWRGGREDRDALGTAAKETGKAVGTAGKKTADAVDKTRATQGRPTQGRTRRATSYRTRPSRRRSRRSCSATARRPASRSTSTPTTAWSRSVATSRRHAHTTALRLARDTKGVKRVVDKITVAGK